MAVAPILPLLTDSEAGLDALFARAAKAGIRRLSHTVLFLRSPTREKYLRWLEGAFPDKIEAYRELIRVGCTWGRAT